MFDSPDCLGCGDAMAWDGRVWVCDCGPVRVSHDGDMVQPDPDAGTGALRTHRGVNAKMPRLPK